MSIMKSTKTKSTKETKRVKQILKRLVIPEDFDPSKTIRHTDYNELNWDDETVCMLCGAKEPCSCYKYRCEECNDFTKTCKCWNEVCESCNLIIAHCKCQKET
jgi:hypothetical protein